MAKLTNDYYPMPQYENYGNDFNKYWKDAQEALDAIPQERLFRYPYADGHAYYYVVSFSPLVLQPVPFGDAWELPEWEINALTATAIKQYIKIDLVLNKIFKKEESIRKES